MAWLEIEPEAAVVQRDTQLRQEHQRTPAGCVRLDQRDTHALVVDGAQIDRVASIDAAWKRGNACLADGVASGVEMVG